MNDGVIVFNTTGTVTKLNKSAEIMLNITSELAIGKHASELLTS